MTQRPVEFPSDTLTLTVAVSTIGERLQGLSLDSLPQTASTQYLVLVQKHALLDLEAACEKLNRSDIDVRFLETVGVAQSRNAAIVHATTDIVLFADDDIVLRTDAYALVMDAFREDAGLDFACCRMTDGTGGLFKAYPLPKAQMSRLNSGRVGTPELAVRVCSFDASAVRFDANFGAGAALNSGDEYIFICDALKAGLKGKHLDAVVAEHSGESTGHDTSAAAFDVRKKVLKRALSPWSWPYRVGYLAKHWKRFPKWRDRVAFILP